MFFNIVINFKLDDIDKLTSMYIKTAVYVKKTGEPPTMSSLRTYKSFLKRITLNLCNRKNDIIWDALLRYRQV